MAPRKRGGRGISFIFCCFRNNDHPEITYRLRNDSNFALQTMEPSLPMPPGEELDVMFSELVVSPRLPSRRWLGGRREKKGSGRFGEPWACPASVKCPLGPYVCSPTVSPEPVEKHGKEEVALLHQRALLVLNTGVIPCSRYSRSSSTRQCCIRSHPYWFLPRNLSPHCVHQ